MTFSRALFDFDLIYVINLGRIHFLNKHNNKVSELPGIQEKIVFVEERIHISEYIENRIKNMRIELYNIKIN